MQWGARGTKDMDDFIFIESLEAQMQAQGDKTALVFKGKETSYAQLSSLSNKVANALIKDGVKPHSRVAFMGNNSAIYFELLLGVQKTRAHWSVSIRGLRRPRWPMSSMMRKPR